MSKDGVITGLSILEAFDDPRVRDLDLWVRPSSWRGSGNALSIHMRTRKIVFVPSGETIFWKPNYDSLISEWEIVDPEVVIEERSRRSGP